MSILTLFVWRLPELEIALMGVSLGLWYRVFPFGTFRRYLETRKRRPRKRRIGLGVPESMSSSRLYKVHQASEVLKF